MICSELRTWRPGSPPAPQRVDGRPKLILSASAGSRGTRFILVLDGVGSPTSFAIADLCSVGTAESRPSTARSSSHDVTPYVQAIGARTTPSTLTRVSAQLARETTEYSRKRLIIQDPAVVQTWRRRVEDFRQNRQLIQLRVLPYTRVPDLLHAEARTDVIEAAKELAGHLALKQARSVKRIVADFLDGTMTLNELHDEWNAMKKAAAKTL